MNAVTLFLGPALLWKEYICFCENLAGSIPRQLRYFSTTFPQPEVLGGGKEQKHPAQSQPGSSWVFETRLCASCARPKCLPSFCTCSVAPQVLWGSTGQAQQVQHHNQGATVCQYLQRWGTGCEQGAEKSNGSVGSV